MSDKKERIDIHSYLAEFEDIPGTRVFTAQRARRGEHARPRDVLHLGEVGVDVDALFLVAHFSVHSYFSGVSRKRKARLSS